MGSKEKVANEVVVKTTNNISNMIVQYTPLIIGLVSLLVCYLLFKKIQSLDSQRDSVTKIEKQFTDFSKEQSEVNIVNSKKFNALISQINQLSYIIQNSNNRETNSINSQLSPEREIIQKEQYIKNSQELQNDQKLTEQPKQRELMPTSVIQTNFPINTEEKTVPNPISTTIKKEILSNEKLDIPNEKKNSNKKVIDIQKLKEEVLIEEASTDDEN
jgi:hypothetical protein